MSLPTVYEYYTSGGINAGLSANKPYFTLNDRNITLFSGALHYFRVPQEYWRDRLKKLRAAGLNAVETYVPWNLHEPEPGIFDFGYGGSDFQEFLDIEKFLSIAQEEDLLAIVRPGPYICGEWDFGGMPSWLLREKGIKLRSSDETFMKHVQRFFKALFSIVTALQFTMGGPIIAFQIENEYGSAYSSGQKVDMAYLEVLKKLYLANGVVELLFTSDGPAIGNVSQMNGILYTGNFQDQPEYKLSLIEKYQPGKPLMVMEYWTGWFDHWLKEHHTRSNAVFKDVLERIITYPASVNLYMFHGGTNWGFMNGANDDSTDNAQIYHDTTSYDYDAPLTEAGDYTEKYFIVRHLIKLYSNAHLLLPELPKLTARIAYSSVVISQQLSLSEILAQETPIKSRELLPMELLPINNNSGQRHGYIIYQKRNLDIKANSTLRIEGRVCDSVLVLINGQLRSKILETPDDIDGFGYWKLKDSTLCLGSEEYTNATLDLVVENWGRNNFGKLNQFNQFKGIWQGNVSLNREYLFDWNIYALEFKKSWIKNLTGWRDPPTFSVGPSLYRGVFTVDEVKDTYVDMRGWKKGIVIVNGFVLSRYLRIGPQQSSYLPAPFLKKGENEIIIFEHFVPDKNVKFSTDIIFESLRRNTNCFICEIFFRQSKFIFG